MPQVPPVQAAVPFGSVGHAWPHDPQFAALVIVSAQLPAQRVGVAEGQPDAHVELTQAGVPLSGRHALLQLPQCGLLLVRLTHVPPQSVRPLLHVKPQIPPLQVAVALVTLGHLVPQPPQLFGSELVSTHVLLKKVPHDWPQTPPLVQHPLHVDFEQPPPASSGAPSGVFPSVAGASGVAPSSAASAAARDPSSPESVPTASSALSGTVPSSPVEVSGAG
jgi:hypothetical protein